MFDDCPQDIYARINTAKRFFIQKVTSMSQFKVRKMGKVASTFRFKSKLRMRVAAKMHKSSMKFKVKKSMVKMQMKESNDEFDLNDTDAKGYSNDEFDINSDNDNDKGNVRFNDLDTKKSESTKSMNNDN